MALHGVLGVDELEGRAPDHLLGTPAADLLGRGRDVDVSVVHVHPRHDVARLHREQPEALLAARQGGRSSCSSLTSRRQVTTPETALSSPRRGTAFTAAHRRRPAGSRTPMRAPSWLSPVARASAVGRSSAGQDRPVGRDAAPRRVPGRARGEVAAEHLVGTAVRGDGRPAASCTRTPSQSLAASARRRSSPLRQRPASVARAAESTVSRQPPGPVTAAASTSRAIVQSATGPCGAGSSPPGGIRSGRSRGRRAARPPGSTCGP